ncbi:AraC family transcriptional regulator [Psychroserpens burtonensis]|uniref:AraC family transcriptional regulator n=1 Tax=Psychroserpens burtonensis TaxID=49278 RepID=A0A5C7BB95_9FLAO|nr:helix-turn-helix domain-containing protein [Psychroserpens burtonensis]TXE20323.1 AraC family transcriptional regulator [Psychroserpens burtonensis]
MNVLSVFPVLSVIFGLVLMIFILFNKFGLGNNKRIRYVLSFLLFIYVITALDYHLSITNQIPVTYSGVTYFFYHFTGLLFYYFIALYTKSEINTKKWVPIVVGYTLLRILVFLPFDQNQDLQGFVAALETSNYGILVLVEYILVSSINIALMFLAYKKLKKAPLLIELNENQKNLYKWIKIIIIAIVFLQIIVFVTTILGSLDIGNFNFYLKFETLIYSIFFFIFAFSIMHFPVFAYSGNFEDLPTSTIEKYAKSSLSDSSDLFEKIKAIVNEEKMYLDFDLKLNTIAEKLDQSIHHISQAINQNAKMSFTDFISSFRIEEAKKKLIEPKPDTIFAISLDVGFNSKAAFYTAFKKHTQMTPTEFKKLYKPID